MMIDDDDDDITTSIIHDKCSYEKLVQLACRTE